MEANCLGFNGICAFSGRRRGRRQQGASGDFVNLEDLLAQSSKMLIKGAMSRGLRKLFLGAPQPSRVRARAVPDRGDASQRRGQWGTLLQKQPLLADVSTSTPLPDLSTKSARPRASGEGEGEGGRPAALARLDQLVPVSPRKGKGREAALARLDTDTSGPAGPSAAKEPTWPPPPLAPVPPPPRPPPPAPAPRPPPPPASALAPPPAATPTPVAMRPMGTPAPLAMAHGAHGDPGASGSGGHGAHGDPGTSGCGSGSGGHGLHGDAGPHGKGTDHGDHEESADSARSDHGDQGEGGRGRRRWWRRQRARSRRRWSCERRSHAIFLSSGGGSIAADL
ncbi:hypothetical protein EJB05_08494 [Eragrostis curvula]|uniref:Uncharacterized protein n=1 Tax=Eragrostis curvula TaxID=38414 RepID=A0A5J9W2J0_9POAL|nr:hypothetical protein EJB05_08494 [Eragrostis curvula]